MRAEWTDLSDRQLLEQCDVDTYRASGPGGQKRNKTSSAVRLRHQPTGLIVIAEESRSQHDNRTRALKRLRQAFYLKLRDDVNLTDLACLRDGVREDWRTIGRKHPRFWPLVGVVLDVFLATEARVREAAAALGISTGKLIDFLMLDDKVFEQANILRTQFGHKALRAS